MPSSNKNMDTEPNDSLQREAYEESNSLGNCQKCGARLQEHSHIGTFCPICTYHSIEKSFATSDVAAVSNDGADLPRISGVSQPQALPIKRQRE